MIKTKAEVKINLELKDGNKVELSKEEAKELIEILKTAIEMVVVKEIQIVKEKEYIPYQPYIPIYPQYPTHPFWEVTYSSGNGNISVFPCPPTGDSINIY